MGVNAIVHRVELKSISPHSFENQTKQPTNLGTKNGMQLSNGPFSLSKMLASLQAGSEAGLGKRL